MYTFIHPTKCGGTACEILFNTHYNHYICGSGHENLCNDYNNPIIIIREPIDRFISMYKYWKKGSIDTKFKRKNNFIEKYNNYTIKDFIKLIKDNSTVDLYKDFTWKEHFSPSTKWINNISYDKLIVILYEHELDNKIKNLLNKLNITITHDILEQCNISVIENEIYIDNEDIEFIKNYFKDDFDLYNDICNKPELFKLVL
jgi:hypothetical protein